MDKYREMQSFVAVVDEGSFINAANALDTSKAAISRHVNNLEERLGVRLLHRTTRRISLTDEGSAFFQRSKEALAVIDEAEAEANSRLGEPAGMLRINAPLTFGILHLARLWGEFSAQYPKVMLDVTLSDRVVDLVEEGYDLAIRIAHLQTSSLVSRQLATTRIVLCASPDYLRKHGIPTAPHELNQHTIIAYSYFSSRDEWHFQGPTGPVQVKVNARIHTNNGDTCRIAALQHQGIILQPAFLVADDLKSGALIELMPDYQAAEIGIHVVFASRKQQPLKVRRMIDFLVASFKQPGW